MNKDDYKKELDQIKASEEFKKKTIALLEEELEVQEKAEKQEPKKKKIIWFTPQKITAAIVAVSLVGFSAVIVKSVTGMQKSIAVLQDETNFNIKTFGGEELAPNMQAATAPEEKQSSYFSPQSMATNEAMDTQENAAIPNIDIAQQSEQTEAALQEDAEKPKTVTNPWPSKNSDYMGIFSRDILEDLAIKPIVVDENFVFPVYKNNYQQTKTGYIPEGISQQEMESILYEQAEVLAMSIQKTEVQSIAMNEGQSAQGIDKVVGTTTNQDTITVYRNGKVEIIYSVPLILEIGPKPEPEEDAESQQEYASLLMEEYHPLLVGMISPALKLTKSYMAEGATTWNYEVVEQGNKTEVEKMIGENFTKLTFEFTSDGGLKQMTMERAGVLTITEKSSLKTQEQAKQELLANEGFTFYEQEAEITVENIAATELIYWNLPTMQYIIPYYKFYVKQEPEENQAQEIIKYIEYYVPAI